MLRPTLFLALLFSSGLSLFAQRPTAPAPAQQGRWLAPVCKPRLYGLEDTSGTQILAPVYEKLIAQTGDAWIATYFGKMGVVNSKGEWLIPAKYEDIKQYRAGRAVMQKKMPTKRSADQEIEAVYDYTYARRDSSMYYGTIDASGNWIVDPQYNYLAVAEDGSYVYGNLFGKYGYLNPDGSILLKAQYDFASLVTDERGIVSKGGTYSDNNIYNYIGTGGYDQRLHYSGGKWSVVNRSGQTVTKIEYDYIRDYHQERAAFNKGGIWKSGRYGGNGKLISGRWGFLDKEGNEIIAPIYDYVYDFENGVAKVRLAERIFWVDRNGKEVAAPAVQPMSNEPQIFCEPGFYGYIDQTGKWSIEPQFMRAAMFSEGLAAVMPIRASDNVCEVETEDNSSVEYYEEAYRPRLLRIGVRRSMRAQVAVPVEKTKRRLYGYIDATGKMLIEPKYDVALPFVNGRAYVCFRNKWGVIDRKGNWIVQPIFDWPQELNYLQEDVSRAWLYNDEQKDQVEPYAYDIRFNTTLVHIFCVYEFSEGMGIIYKDNHYGLIDTTGKIVLPPLYDLIRPFENGLAAFRRAGKWGFLDKTGKEVIAPQFVQVGSFSKEGLAKASFSSNPNAVDDASVYESELKYGFIDRKGAWAIPPKFSSAEDFSEGLAMVSMDYQNKGFIDKTGKFVINPKYEDASSFSNGFAWVKMSMIDPVYIDKQGKVSKIYKPGEKIPLESDVFLTRAYGENNRIGYRNRDSDLVIQPEYSRGGDFVRVD